MSKKFVPRDWQDRKVRAYQINLKKNFLLEACTSAGKTAGALYAFDSMKSVLDWRFVIVVVPAEHLMRQYAQDAHNLFDLNLFHSGTVKRLGRLPTPEELLSQGYHGLVVSYQWLTKSRNAEWMADALSQKLAGKVFLVLDEVHHVSSELAYGQACETAFPDQVISHRLMTSGTPFRSDNNRILGNWLTYVPVGDNTYQCVPDFRYTLADALNDRIIPPFSFVTMEGEFTYQRGRAVYNGKTFTNATNEQELTDALNTAIFVEGDWVKESIFWAYKRMQRDRAKELPECATYVRVPTIAAAHQMKERIRRLTGEDALVVVSKDEEPNSNSNFQSKQDPSELIEQFAAETGSGARSWIIGVGMLSEGVSIKRLKYRIHATNIRAPLSFIQDLGRLLRLFPEDPPEVVETLIPAHPALIELAINVMNEVAHVVEEREQDNSNNNRVEENGNAGNGEGNQTIVSTFIPIASTGELSMHIVDGEEITSEYANVAEWAIENKPIWQQWGKSPAHLAQLLMNDEGQFNYLLQEYKQTINNVSNISCSSYVPPGFPSEYATFLPDKKINFARKKAHEKANRLAYIIFENASEEERVEGLKIIHTKAKLRNRLPLNGFIGYEGWEKIYHWLCNRIAEAKRIKGIDDL
ncbi:MAG: DEAD/DEAH box helicase family protein [Scytonema sp. PMC 1069.18]|nr:DEAD/DEAH box helicase family protein [Scytonema sp. PMC 1069.18]MEC4883079.1 DEAD/DEAH box helicase family protein [Scytonema sp. PMC 1070.18]